MVPVTAFNSLAPLHLEVREAISAALEQGWADPRHLSQAGHRAGLLKSAAIEEFAAFCGVPASKIEVTGEPALLPYLSLLGFKNETRSLHYSAIDRGKIRAIGATTPDSHILTVDSNGEITPPQIQGALLSLQSINGETGIRQNLNNFKSDSQYVVIDATADFPSKSLTEGCAASTFDALSWGGPSGIGFLVLGDEANFHYPLPHIAPIRTPGSYSLPLLIGAVTALTHYSTESAQETYSYAKRVLGAIDGVTVVASETLSQEKYLSLIVRQISSDELLRRLAERSIYCDAGSACNPAYLAPSHVLNAMGYSTDGHLRITIHPTTNVESVDVLADAISEILRTI